jgi:hypothetical protein
MTARLWVQLRGGHLEVVQWAQEHWCPEQPPAEDEVGSAEEDEADDEYEVQDEDENED